MFTLGGCFFGPDWTIWIRGKNPLPKDDDFLDYVTWENKVKVFLHGKWKLNDVTDLPPPKGDLTFADWESKNSIVMGSLWHILKPHVATAKEPCDSPWKNFRTF